MVFSSTRSEPFNVWPLNIRFFFLFSQICPTHPKFAFSPLLIAAINNKGSPIDYKTGSACSTPTKDTLKSCDRYMGPVLPPRSAMCGPPSHHYSAPLNFRKGFTFTKCTWKCTAILVILLSVILVITLLLTGNSLLVLLFHFNNIIIMHQPPHAAQLDESARRARLYKF